MLSAAGDSALAPALASALHWSLSRICWMKQAQWNKTQAPRHCARKLSLCCRTGSPQRPHLRCLGSVPEFAIGTSQTRSCLDRPKDSLFKFSDKQPKRGIALCALLDDPERVHNGTVITTEVGSD
jgi:hypothetical protein